MDDLKPNHSRVHSLPVADITAPIPKGNIDYEAYPVRKPEEDLNDFKVQVRASTLSRCRTRLEKISNTTFLWYEMSLAGSTVSMGAYLGSLAANIPSGSFLDVLFNTIIPVISSALFVSYIFLRRARDIEPKQAITDVLSELPDPKRSR